jgi:hypothetical protein
MTDLSQQVERRLRSFQSRLQVARTRARNQSAGRQASQQASLHVQASLQQESHHETKETTKDDQEPPELMCIGVRTLDERLSIGAQNAIDLTVTSPQLPVASVELASDDAEQSFKNLPMAFEVVHVPSIAVPLVSNDNDDTRASFTISEPAALTDSTSLLLLREQLIHMQKRHLRIKAIRRSEETIQQDALEQALEQAVREQEAQQHTAREQRKQQRRAAKIRERERQQAARKQRELQQAIPTLRTLHTNAMKLRQQATSRHHIMTLRMNAMKLQQQAASRQAARQEAARQEAAHEQEATRKETCSCTTCTLS